MDPVVQENWFPCYDVLRDESPVYYMPQLDMYVVTGYDEIEHILKRPTLFTGGADVDEREPLITHEASRELYARKGWPRYTPLSENLPRHKHFRAVVDPKLTVAEIRRREPFIRATINELIDGWIDRGEIEFIHDFAEPLPMRVIAELLGFPRMDLPQLKVWSSAWVLPFSRGLTPEQELEAVAQHIELQHYIHDAIREKRRQPHDDILSHLTQVSFYDVDTDTHRKLTDPEIIGLTDHLLIGGNETTTFALSNGLWLGFRHPTLFDALRREPARIKNFVEETLRIESPTQGLFRHVAEDTEVGGVHLPRGAILSIRYGAGNHDPRRFPEPATPDLTRRNAGRHLAFGMGEKVCPGAALSRIEQQLAWEVLLARLRTLAPAPDKDTYEHMKGMWMRALLAIHLRFEAA